MNAISAARAKSPAATRGIGFRPDIEGLRAVAVGLVLIYHAGITFVPGGFIGVDVFFVISGFLITGMLMREVARSGRVSLVDFYARRAKRLLPAASLVLLVTAALVVFLAPPLQRRVFGGDIVASAISLVNWRFADRAVDYQAEGIGASPVQHFWSLAVEEQFYVVWPLLLIGVAWVVRRRWGGLRRVATGALLMIVVPSFAWSLHLSSSDPERAFFVTTTRLWEMGIGALLAVAVSSFTRIPVWMSRILGWAGLALIVGAALTFDSSTTWPGWAAVVPTLATAMVIMAGSGESARSPWVLRSAPAVWVGGLSYSLYLWHWPLLVAAGWQFGELGQKAGLAVVLLSFVPAWLSYTFVERPFRASPRLGKNPALALTMAGNLAAVGIIAGLVAMLSTPAAATSPDSDPATAGSRGAETLLWEPGESVSGIASDPEPGGFFPALVESSDDRPVVNDTCWVPQDVVTPEPCLFESSPDAPRLLLAGDSKAAQWADAFAEATSAEGWSFMGATKSACGFSSALRLDGNERPYTACVEYNEKLEDWILEEMPDVVVVSQRHSTAMNADGELTQDAMVSALVEQWTALEDAGVDVVVLLDNPPPTGLPSEYGGQVPACLASNLESPGACTFSRAVAEEASGAVAQLRAAELVPAVDVLDLTDTLCNSVDCPPVIGDVLVYRQGSHITNTYALSTTEILQDRLSPLLAQARVD